MPTPLLETRQLYAQIKSDLITLHYRLKLFYQIYDQEKTMEFLGKLAPDLFFRVLYYDQIDNLSLGISRLLDRGNTRYGDRASLERFISDIRPLDENLSTELTTDLDNTRRKSQRIIDWRNNWAGHRDHAVTLQLQARMIGKGSSPIGFNLTEVQESLKDVGLMLNKFDAKYHDKGQTFANPTWELVEALRYAVDEPVDYETRAVTEDGEKIIRLLLQANDQ